MLPAPLPAIVVVVWGSIVRRGFPLTITVTSSSNIEMLVVRQRGAAWVARSDAPLFGTASNKHSGLLDGERGVSKRGAVVKSVRRNGEVNTSAVKL
ncbi:hypothetical protein CDAR_114121 [Caerostris darwini]|uniref:Secreted protein n=1 Tax=Caerostris darwini TaxID=1538125 RepID=A0AAV4VPA4_9ARAC|nr:hypothetical protein CDAR_114121 [Caerostris darwini]